MVPPSQSIQREPTIAGFATSPLMMANMACALSSHSLRFTGQRFQAHAQHLQAHAQHLQALAQCESLQDLFAQQMAYIGETARQFSDVMARAMEPIEADQPRATLHAGNSAEDASEEATGAAPAMRPRQAGPRRSADGDATQSH